MKLQFRKMHGLGNDFVILDARDGDVGIDEARARALADRRTGIGCDQLILLEPSDRADVRMRIWNPDGSEVEACGNATRCVASLLGGESTIETKGGLIHSSATHRPSRSNGTAMYARSPFGAYVFSQSGAVRMSNFAS